MAPGEASKNFLPIRILSKLASVVVLRNLLITRSDSDLVEYPEIHGGRGSHRRRRVPTRPDHIQADPVVACFRIDADDEVIAIR